MSEKLNIAQAQEELAEEEFAPAPTFEETQGHVAQALSQYKEASADKSPAGSMGEFGTLQASLTAHEANGGTLADVEAATARDEKEPSKRKSKIGRAISRIALIPRARRVEKARVKALKYGDHSSGTTSEGQSEGPRRHSKGNPNGVTLDQLAEKLNTKPTSTSDGFDELASRSRKEFAEENRKFDAILGRQTEAAEEKEPSKRKGKIRSMIAKVALLRHIPRARRIEKARTAALEYGDHSSGTTSEGQSEGPRRHSEGNPNGVTVDELKRKLDTEPTAASDGSLDMIVYKSNDELPPMIVHESDGELPETVVKESNPLPAMEIEDKTEPELPPIEILEEQTPISNTGVGEPVKGNGDLETSVIDTENAA